MKRSMLMVPVLAGCLWANSANAGVPLSFTHHGVLKEDGNLVNGSRKIIATVYDDQGVVVGTKSQDVNVSSGLYAMTIDNIDVAKVVTSNGLTLSINVEGEDLQPALNIMAVPYALAAKQSEVATDVVCHGCITPDHLSFNALQDSALPNCGENQVLRQGAGAVWECTDVVQLDNSRNAVMVTGKIGVNTQDFSFGFFHYDTYQDNITAAVIPAGVMNCDCDQGKDDNDFECGQSFTSKIDNGGYCFDNWGGVNRLYRRSSYMAPLSDVVVINDGLVGIGTGGPEAPLHLRADRGSDNYEVIVADTAPEILLEDLDGNNYAVSLDDGKLSVSSITDGVTSEVMTFDDNGLTVAGTISAGGFARDFAVGSANVDFNYAGSKSKGGAASSIEDNIVTSAKIQDGTIAAADLAANAVITTKIKDANVTKAKLENAVQTSLGLADNSIQKTTGSVTSAYIEDGTIATADLANGAVSTSKIADGNVTTAKLADKSVTADKLDKTSVLNIIYPVGSVYISMTNNNATTIGTMLGGTWTRLADGYFLESSSSGAGNTIAAGLPNITGNFNGVEGKWHNSKNGAFSGSTSSSTNSDDGTNTATQYNINFNASNSNSIYGNSTTVQPPAIKVYMFRRTK